MKNFCLDANLFFNMEAGFDLGKTTQKVVETITKIILKEKQTGRAEFFMPPRVVDEFLSFFEDKNQLFIKELLSTITIKSPDQSKFSFAAQIFYELIEDVRVRNYQGLQVAQEEIEHAGRMMTGINTTSSKEFQMKIGPVIKKFRQRFRQATRVGFLDSLADLDLILLAKELDGFLVTSDEGVFRWGRKFGVKEIRPVLWRKQLQEV